MHARDLDRSRHGQHLTAACECRVYYLLELLIREIAAECYYLRTRRGEQQRNVAHVPQRARPRGDVYIYEANRPVVSTRRKRRAGCRVYAVRRGTDEQGVDRIRLRRTHPRGDPIDRQPL